jgi:hypothetical protein
VEVAELEAHRKPAEHEHAGAEDREAQEHGSSRPGPLLAKQSDAGRAEQRQGDDHVDRVHRGQAERSAVPDELAPPEGRQELGHEEPGTARREDRMIDELHQRAIRPAECRGLVPRLKRRWSSDDSPEHERQRNRRDEPARRSASSREPTAPEAEHDDQREHRHHERVGQLGQDREADRGAAEQGIAGASSFADEQPEAGAGRQAAHERREGVVRNRVQRLLRNCRNEQGQPQPKGSARRVAQTAVYGGQDDEPSHDDRVHGPNPIEEPGLTKSETSAETSHRAAIA